MSSSSVEITDYLTTYLVKLGNHSQGLLNQAINKGIAKGRLQIVAKSKRAGSHKFNMRFDNHHQRVLTYGESSKRAYSRQDLSSGHSLGVGMGDLARAKLYPNSSVGLVGFLNTKSFVSYNFTGGVEKKGKRVKGTKTKAIAERMAKGGREELTDEKKALFYRSGWGNAADRGYVMKKARPIVNKSALVLVAEREAKKEYENSVKEFKNRFER